MYVAIHKPFKSGCTYLVALIITPIKLTSNEKMAMTNIIIYMFFRHSRNHPAVTEDINTQLAILK